MSTAEPIALPTSVYLVPAALILLSVVAIYAILRRRSGASVGAILLAVVPFLLGVTQLVILVQTGVDIYQKAACYAVPDLRGCTFCGDRTEQLKLNAHCYFGEKGIPASIALCRLPDTTSQTVRDPQSLVVRPPPGRHAALRAGPGFDFPVVAYARPGEMLPIEGEVVGHPSWFLTRFNISADPLSYSEELNLIPYYRRVAYCSLRLETSAPVYIHRSNLSWDEKR